MICNCKIDIEIDGKAFHQDKERDLKRDKYLTGLGWQVIRIDSSMMRQEKWLSSTLMKLWEKVKNNKSYSYGLIDLFEQESGLINILRVPEKKELIWCNKCGISHFEDNCNGVDNMKIRQIKDILIKKH